MNQTIIAIAAVVAVSGPAPAQTQKPVVVAPPKSIPRADYVKTVDAHFNVMDTNHDGKVSREELAAEQQKELQAAKQKIQRATETRFHQLDTNHDGQLSLQEFMALAPPIHATETADQMLQRLDTNHDGKITLDEFRAPELVKFNKVDANHDGIVTPAEIQAAQGKK